MKKLISTTVAGFIIFLTQAQDPRIVFIDSLADKTNPSKTILLFSELRDTIDDQTGRMYTQRNSYYFDWAHKELRYIDVYEFDQVLRRHTAERIFRKKKKSIPPATHIVYTFFENSLAKVKLTLPTDKCGQCFEEYYFGNDMLIFQNEKNNSGQQRNFINQANFYLVRIQLAKKTNDLVY